MTWLAPVLGGVAGACVLGFVGLRQWQANRLARIEDRLQTLVVGEAASDAWLGRQIGRWVLVERLGSGGMAWVFRALPLDSLDERKAAAIKILKPELVHDGEFLPRFLREISICRRLRHPAIVKVIDSNHKDDLVFVVLELVKGRSLTTVVNSAPLPMDRFFHLYSQLVAGVDHAHRHGVVHRDLKSGNIMVTDDDQVKVLDFGIARSPADHTITDARFIVGTPFYMSPEQLFGAPFDPRMDQYALGVVGYEMVTGRLPFDATNMTSLIQEINYAVPISPRSLNPAVPLGVEQMLLRMLEKQPDARFTNLDFVIAELQRCQRELALQPRQDS